jgi:hypothetical protein
MIPEGGTLLVSRPLLLAAHFAAATLCSAPIAVAVAPAWAADEWSQPNATLAVDSQVFLCEPRLVWRSFRPEASCAGSHSLPAGTRLRVVGMEFPPEPESIRVQWLRDGLVFTGWILGSPERLVLPDRVDRLFMPDLPPDNRLLDAVAGTWTLDAAALRAHEGWHWLDSAELKLERAPRQGILIGTLVHELDLQRQPDGRLDHKRELLPRADRMARVVQPVEATLSGNVLTMVGGKPRLLYVGSRDLNWSTDHLVLRIAEGEMSGWIWTDTQQDERRPVRFVRPPDSGAR